MQTVRVDNVQCKLEMSNRSNKIIQMYKKKKINCNVKRTLGKANKRMNVEN